MNTDLMLEVADAIELYPNNFKMDSYWARTTNNFSSPINGTPAECGTTGCIAGWAATLDGYRTADYLYDSCELHDLGAVALDLNEVQAEEMFECWMCRNNEDIVSDLRGIAKGEITWDAEIGFVRSDGTPVLDDD